MQIQYVAGKPTGGEGEEKNPLLAAFYDIYGINTTIMADFKLPKVHKILESLAMVASTSQLQHTTANHLLYCLLCS